jgi:hypothetical protein
MSVKSEEHCEEKNEFRKELGEGGLLQKVA